MLEFSPPYQYLFFFSRPCHISKSSDACVIDDLEIWPKLEKLLYFSRKAEKRVGKKIVSCGEHCALNTKSFQFFFSCHILVPSVFLSCSTLIHYRFVFFRVTNRFHPFFLLSFDTIILYRFIFSFMSHTE